jgi:hypothetical protein
MRCSREEIDMRTPWVISAVLFAAIILSGCTPKEKESLMAVQSVIGEVKILSGQGERVPGPGDALLQGDTVVTAKSSLVDIMYGKKGIIRINENSRVAMTTLLTKGDQEQSRLEMSEGKLFVTVSKLTKGSTLEVVSPTTIAAVRGTSFRVTADEKSSRIDVLSGKIKVNPVKEGKVIESVETVVETNNAVVMDTKAVDAVIEKKKEIEVVILKPEEVKEIREEVKDIKPAEKLEEAAQQEIREVILEVKDDQAEEKKEEERLLQEKKDRETKLKADQQKKALAEKARIDQARMEKERLEKERLARELAEKKKQETKEQRVKNIPNL